MTKKHKGKNLALTNVDVDIPVQMDEILFKSIPNKPCNYLFCCPEVASSFRNKNVWNQVEIHLSKIQQTEDNRQWMISYPIFEDILW